MYVTPCANSSYSHIEPHIYIYIYIQVFFFLKTPTDVLFQLVGVLKSAKPRNTQGDIKVDSKFLRMYFYHIIKPLGYILM